MNENNESIPLDVEDSNPSAVHRPTRDVLDNWSLFGTPMIPHRLSDYYYGIHEGISSGKSSMARLLALKIDMSRPYHPVPLPLTLPGTLHPFIGLKHRSLSEEATSGMTPSGSATPSGGYLVVSTEEYDAFNAPENIWFGKIHRTKMRRPPLRHTIEDYNYGQGM
ncbi:MAG: hypothetical protein ABIR46_01995 [Candidatus Saccharimonadales bacterium]